MYGADDANEDELADSDCAVCCNENQVMQNNNDDFFDQLTYGRRYSRRRNSCNKDLARD